MNLYRKSKRAKTQAEFAALIHLQRACYMSVFRSPGDDLLDDVRVNARMDQLLELVRSKAPSLTWQRTFVDRASEIIPGLFLKSNHAATSAVLYREAGDNVVYLEQRA